MTAQQVHKFRGMIRNGATPFGEISDRVGILAGLPKDVAEDLFGDAK